MRQLSALELCAGAGGQAIGLHQAGFAVATAAEIDADACETLRANTDWKIFPDDIRNLDARSYRGVDLVAAGVPCPPFSVAGKQLGADDDRDLFPVALDIVEAVQPSAVLLENVRGLAASVFADYRAMIVERLRGLGLSVVFWDLLNARDFGVPQLRSRMVLVALRPEFANAFSAPVRSPAPPPTVGSTLADLMASGGWPGAHRWRGRANGIAPTIVGGSKKHGGPDLGPTRAKQEWRKLGVDGYGIADLPPGSEFPADADPKLTVPMVSRLQGFPSGWRLAGRKTSAYRQVGNAFPPAVACAVGERIAAALTRETSRLQPDEQARYELLGHVDREGRHGVRSPRGNAPSVD